MRLRSSSLCLAALVISGMMAQTILIHGAAAQDKKRRLLKETIEQGQAHSTVVPAAADYSHAEIVKSTTTITRKPKPNRKPLPARKPQATAPLLSLQWWVLVRGEDGAGQEANPAATFKTGDKLQIGVKTNQSGYLYIIHHTEGENGQLVFPDSRISNG